MDYETKKLVTGFNTGLGVSMILAALVVIYNDYPLVLACAAVFVGACTIYTSVLANKYIELLEDDDEDDYEYGEEYEEDNDDRIINFKK